MDVSYLSLAGKTALVTGGSRGIGRAIALALADAGADVAISSRKMPALQEVATEIKAMGRRALPVAAHNRKPEALRQLMATVQAAFGRLDILVNNAATNPILAPLIDVEETTFDVIMDTNLKGYFLLSQMAAKIMLGQGGGVILNISSVGGVTPDKGLGVYCISKAAINMLTQVLAIELGEYNIRVNALAPGVVKTRFSRALWSNEKIMAQEMAHTPLQRIATPEEVGRMALAMVSDASAYITGQIVVMDGGGSI
ncbi:MAG: glucose 1-dehydrogenase [Chloroflexi bacterium]|nr:glucose 1-dehydrogenase [Chloroflexota bacterium]